MDRRLLLLHLSIRHSINQSTVFMCAIDLSKAFDKVNHHALFIKLMRRNLPVPLLDILENWFKNCVSIVKWNHIFSYTFVRSDTRLCFVAYNVCYLFKWCSCSPLANSQIIYHTVRLWYFINSPFNFRVTTRNVPRASRDHVTIRTRC